MSLLNSVLAILGVKLVGIEVEAKPVRQIRPAVEFAGSQVVADMDELLGAGRGHWQGGHQWHVPGEAVHQQGTEGSLECGSHPGLCRAQAAKVLTVQSSNVFCFPNQQGMATVWFGDRVLGVVTEKGIITRRDSAAWSVVMDRG